MKLPDFDYRKPVSLTEACEMLSSEEDARPIAGGTDLIPAMKYGLKKPRVLVDISCLPALREITLTEKGLTIGAAVTLREIVKSGHNPLLTQACAAVGSTQLQAMGTLGGNLCQDTCCLYYNLPPMTRQALRPCFKRGGDTCHVTKSGKVCLATYAGDVAPALLALGAEVTIASPVRERTIPLGELFSGKGETPQTLNRGELVKEITIPSKKSFGSYLKLRVRKSIDYPLLGVAVNLFPNGEKGVSITVGLTAVERKPLSFTLPPDLSEEKRIEVWMTYLADEAYKRAHPVANTSGYSPQYRREMVKVYVKRAIEEALKKSDEKNLLDSK